MPVTVRKIRGRFRIVDASTNRIEKTRKGNPRDGGGHRSRSTAAAQARAINRGDRKSRGRS